MTKNPTQLALACFYYTTKGDVFDFIEYLKSRIGSMESDEKMEKLEALLVEMCRDIDAVKVIII